MYVLEVKYNNKEIRSVLVCVLSCVEINSGL